MVAARAACMFDVLRALWICQSASHIVTIVSTSTLHAFTARNVVLTHRAAACRWHDLSLARLVAGRCVLSEDSYLVDPASSHMLVSKIKPCMSKYKHLYTVKLQMAHYIRNNLFDGDLLHG